MRSAPLNPDGTLKIIPIEADDDGLDPEWIHLPDQERWERLRALLERGSEFERRFAGRSVSWRVAKTENVFVGLPRSHAQFLEQLKVINH